MEKVLKVENVIKNYAAEKAVDEVSFDLYDGEILGLLGPNGAGKTTIIRMILNIIAPDNGKISFSNFSIVKFILSSYYSESHYLCILIRPIAGLFHGLRAVPLVDVII